MPKTSITSGEFRGRQIATPDTDLTHPMGSREKLALFNALESLRGPLLADTLVLDCFCGSGALGLEALSRGAGEAIFVDNNPKSIATTKQNIKILGVGGRAFTLKSDYRSISESLHSAPGFSNKSDHFCAKSQDLAGKIVQFDVILADPPYDNYPINLTNLGDLLSNSGVLALSHPTSVDPTQLLLNCELVRTKKYAAACISLFVKHNH